MNAWALLIRGVNVGGYGRLPMADLRALLTTLGARNISTLIQSGNAVFTGVIDARAFGGLIEDEIEIAHGFRPRTLVLSRESYTAIVENYPWPEVRRDPTAGHIWFLGTPPAAPDIDALTALAAPGERIALTEGAFYLHAPDGIGQSKLAEKAERLLGVPATARNLNTATRLAEMLAALGKD